jgi:dipeptidyl aminopeptidase/acylaminoacyl peptidase
MNCISAAELGNGPKSWELIPVTSLLGWDVIPLSTSQPLYPLQLLTHPFLRALLLELTTDADMVRRAAKFTPEVLLSAPRRSAGVPNSDASQLLYSVSTYSFGKFETTSEIRILDVETKESVVVTDSKASEPHWIGGTQVLLLVPGKKSGTTEIHIGDPKDWKKSSYSAGVIQGIGGNLKLRRAAGSKNYMVALAASAKPDGTMYNEAEAPKKNTTGMVYDSTFVRHWDTYVTPIRNAVWYGQLVKSKSGQYQLSKLTNALAGSKLECPIPPFGGAEDFDISETGLALVAKDPHLDPSTHTKQNLYMATWKTGTEPGKSLDKLYKIPMDSEAKGALSSPVFSNSGHWLVFLGMQEDGYEADRNVMFAVANIKVDSLQAEWTGEIRAFNYSEVWDRSPSGLFWSKDDKTLYITAPNAGNAGLFEMSLVGKDLPKTIISEGGISSVKVLDDGRLFVSGSTLVDNSVYYILDLRDDIATTQTIVSSNSNFGSTFGLAETQYEHFYYEGVESKIGAWLLKPSDFDPTKKYPLAYLIHGGPQDSWANSWNVRWNPAVIAEQGYVVICPNPTGSVGYGQRLTDAIQMQWGGKPYEDLVLGIEHIETEFDFVDMDRAVALGASYGGYMVNWIQGHPLGRKFKALVTHDGVFSMAGQLASEEQYFPIHEFGNKRWMQNQDAWLQWDPAKWADFWETPHLIIHSEKDYRLTIAEGLSAFNVLQQNEVPSRMLVFPDENHWVLNPANSLLWHAVVLGWINKHVGLPEYPAKGDVLVKGLLKEAQMSL